MTGHKGIIGSRLLERLKELGHEPVLLVDLKEGKDIANFDEFKINERADMMIHLASFNKINKCIANPDLPFKNIALGTYKVMEFCRKNNIPKIIYTSSSRILKEEKNAYTAAKIYGEELCKGYQQCYNIDYVIIRPSTVYGPRDTNTPRLVGTFIKKASEDQDLEIYGDETKTLDLTYVEDFVDGFLLAMNQKNQEYDIGTGKGTKVSRVADIIIGEIGKGRKIFCHPEIAQPQHVEIDISKMRNLGYSPKVSVEEGIKKTIEWFREEGLISSDK